MLLKYWVKDSANQEEEEEQEDEKETEDAAELKDKPSGKL